MGLRACYFSVLLWRDPFDGQWFGSLAVARCRAPTKRAPSRCRIRGKYDARFVVD